MRPVRIQRVANFRNGSRVTIHDRFFSVLCSFHGLIIAPKLRRRLDTALMILWMVFLALQWILLLWSLEDLLDDPTEPASLLQIVTSIADFIDVVASSYIVFSFFRKRRVIEPLLRKSGRRFKDVFMLLLYAIPLISLQFYQAVWETESAIVVFNLLSAIFVETSMASFLVVYADLLNSLVESSSELRTLCKNPGETLDKLSAAKWSLRDNIDAVNEFSRLPLLSHYVKMIGSVLYVFLMILGQLCSGCEMIAYVSYSAGHILTMYYLAQKTSRLDVLRNKQLQYILMRTSIHNAEIIVAERIFKFRRSLDSVHLGCYTHGVENFVETILLFITMVLPIIFQFDHIVVGRMSKSDSDGLAVTEQLVIS